MATKKRSFFIMAVLFSLVFALLLPTKTTAAVIEPTQPMASIYLDSYNTYICAMGDGELQIWFSVTGDNYMDDVGTLTIALFESTTNTESSTWTHVKTYTHDEYTNMLGHGVVRHNNYVPYEGVAGRYYKAYVTIWAGIGDNGDARYMWTTVEQAT